jgi:hypothetical protein
VISFEQVNNIVQEQQRFCRFDTPDNRRTLALHVRLDDHVNENDSHAISSDVPLTAVSHNVEKSFDDYLNHVDFEKYLEDPEYFIKVVMESDLTDNRRPITSIDPWKTRFMTITSTIHNNAKPVSVVDSVRTHLK